MTTKAISPKFAILDKPLDLEKKPSFFTRITNFVMQIPLIPNSLVNRVNKQRRQDLSKADQAASYSYGRKEALKLGETERAALETKAATYLSYYLEQIDSKINQGKTFTKGLEKAINVAENALITFDEHWYLQEKLYAKIIDKIADHCLDNVTKEGLIDFEERSMHISLFHIKANIVKHLGKDVENDIRQAVIKKSPSELKLVQLKAKQIAEKHPDKYQKINELNEKIAKEKLNLQAFKNSNPKKQEIYKRLFELRMQRREICLTFDFYSQIETYRTNLYAFGFYSEKLPSSYPKFIEFFAKQLQSEYQNKYQIFDPMVLSHAITVVARDKFSTLFRDCKDVLDMNLKTRNQLLYSIGQNFGERSQKVNKEYKTSMRIVNHDLQLALAGNPLSYQKFVETSAEYLKAKLEKSATFDHYSNYIEEVTKNAFDSDPEAFDDCKSYAERIDMFKQDIYKQMDFNATQITKLESKTTIQKV